MSLKAEVAAARDDVARARAQISGTMAELETRIAAPVKAATGKLDVVQLVRDHPWASLAVAAAAGALVGGTGADVRAADAAKEHVTRAGHAAASAASAAADAAREVPDRARSAAQTAARGASAYVDGLAGTLLLAFINRLRESESASAVGG